MTLPLLSALAGLPAMAWGPYSQAVIADRAAEALGTPKGTSGPDFINSAVVAKGWEYTNRAYVKLDPDFTRIQAKFGGDAANLPQILAWGSTQAAEMAGDEVFFFKADHPYDRWLLELMVDANLMHGSGEPGAGDILETLGGDLQARIAGRHVQGLLRHAVAGGSLQRSARASAGRAAGPVHAHRAGHHG